MGFILEFVLSFWLETAMSILPEKSHRKVRTTAKIIVMILILYAVMAMTVGSIMLSDGIGSKTAAVILMVSAVAVVAFQIVVGIVCYLKKK